MGTLEAMTFRVSSLLAAALLLGCSDQEGARIVPASDAGSQETGGVTVRASGGKSGGTGGRRATDAGGVGPTMGGARNGLGGKTGNVDAAADSELATGGTISDEGGYDAARSDSASADGARPDATAIDSGRAPDADGAPCECSSGPCCDGCRLFQSTHVCFDEEHSGCAHDSALNCPGLPDGIVHEWRRAFCSGTTTSCDGVVTVYRSEYEACPTNSFCHGCLYDYSGQCSAPLHCGPCS